MVNVGFICEGYTELFILKSPKFGDLLLELGLNPVGFINVEGNGNLLPKNIEKHRKNLEAEGAEHIVILTDLDEDRCITLTKQRIGERPNQDIIISVRQIESWFLADTSTIRSIFRGNFLFENPENEDIPFEKIRRLYFEKFNKGLVGKDEKKKLASKMLQNGFSVKNAADHPNCPSASYFLKKLREIKN
jgi:hypothetical protein